MTPSVPVIRVMTIDALRDVLAIERASFQTPWTEANFRHEIEENPFAWNLIVEIGGRIVGFACTYVLADEMMINDVAVDASWQRQGIGRKLMTTLLEGARSRGCRRATLEVRPSNTAARALYGSLGFTVVGRRPGYYVDSGEDALLMMCPF